MGFWIIFSNLENLIQKIATKYNYKKLLNSINFYSSMGMVIAHLGVGFLILGITGSSVWQKEKILQMQVNDNIVVNKNKITFESINELKGPNYLAIQGTFLIYNSKNKLITKLKPEKRYYPITNNFTSEVSIHTNLARDLYLVLGEGNLNAGWVVKIYYNPLVLWIWIGSLTIFFGGIISLLANSKKINT